MALTAKNWHDYLYDLARRLSEARVPAHTVSGVGVLVGDARALRDCAQFIKDSPATKLAVPEPPLTAMELDLDEGALHWVRRIEALEGLMTALQNAKVLTTLGVHSDKIRVLHERVENLEPVRLLKSDGPTVDDFADASLYYREKYGAPLEERLRALEKRADDHFPELWKHIYTLERQRELEDRQEQVARDWKEWHAVDPERAERWRRENIGDD